jgi:hypothetical protein
MGTNLSFNSSYHPQKDGQTKAVNRNLGDLLRSLVTEHHSQWDNILPQVEFSYNDSLNRSTGKNLFQIVYGTHPRGVSKLRDSKQDEIRSASAKYFSEEMKELQNQVKERLQNLSQEYKCRADQHRRQY